MLHFKLCPLSKYRLEKFELTAGLLGNNWGLHTRYFYKDREMGNKFKQRKNKNRDRNMNRRSLYTNIGKYRNKGNNKNINNITDRSKNRIIQ